MTKEDQTALTFKLMRLSKKQSYHEGHHQGMIFGILLGFITATLLIGGVAFAALTTFC